MAVFVGVLVAVVLPVIETALLTELRESVRKKVVVGEGILCDMDGASDRLEVAACVEVRVASKLPVP